jgi:hypothetical protein
MSGNLNKSPMGSSNRERVNGFKEVKMGWILRIFALIFVLCLGCSAGNQALKTSPVESHGQIELRESVMDKTSKVPVTPSASPAAILRATSAEGLLSQYEERLIKGYPGFYVGQQPLATDHPATGAWIGVGGEILGEILGRIRFNKETENIKKELERRGYVFLNPKID